MPCGFLSFADDGTVLEANRALLELCEFDSDQLIGQPIATIFTVASQIFYQTHFFPLLKMKSKAEEIYLTLRTKSGAELPALMNATRNEREGIVRNDCVLLAMHRRSRYEDEILAGKKALDKAHAELITTQQSLQQKQTEVEARNEELETLKEGLEGLVEVRTAELRLAMEDLESFSYAIAHDLRAPLRAIITTSEVLTQDAAPSLAADQRAMLERQSFNARKLANLIEDLLRFARLGREGILRSPVNVSEIATTIIADLSFPAGIKRPTFHVQPGMRGTGDPSLIRIALENLIENAVKYSPGGGEISVGAKTENSERIFFVHDQGIGFDMLYSPKIFLPFERLHTDREFQGSGIGLATVKRIVERHEGQVWAESSPGEGSTFFFTLGS